MCTLPETRATPFKKTERAPFKCLPFRKGVPRWLQGELITTGGWYFLACGFPTAKKGSTCARLVRCAIVFGFIVEFWLQFDARVASPFQQARAHLVFTQTVFIHLVESLVSY